MATSTPSTSLVSRDVFPTTPRKSPRKRSLPNSSENKKAKMASLDFLAKSQEQRNFIIKPLRELAAKLYPYVEDKHVYLLTHLLELNRQSIEQSKCPLLAFMDAAEETGRIASNNVDCLINGFKKLQPCKEVTQALNDIKAYKEKFKPVESENDSNLTSPEDTNKNTTAESHWKKFKEWCDTIRIADPRVASGKNVTDYLERLYPDKKVVTIRTHYASIKKHLSLNPAEVEDILQFLNKLAIREMQKNEGH